MFADPISVPVPSVILEVIPPVNNDPSLPSAAPEYVTLFPDPAAKFVDASWMTE